MKIYIIKETDESGNIIFVSEDTKIAQNKFHQLFLDNDNCLGFVDFLEYNTDTQDKKVINGFYVEWGDDWTPSKRVLVNDH